ncbi:MAG: hypothetical protein GF364_03285 [Candidatus Lokiarchaeota archaeon]|nr:hypothetical protein [Candidatus Lokiarchaeota archaeon]
MRDSFKIDSDYPRLVLLGNSNVGKSSIARYLLKKRNLTVGAIGKHAGSTVKLNLYNSAKIPYQIADLPGFGAMLRTSKKKKNEIHDSIIQYVETDRENIFLTLIVLNALRIEDELEKWYFKNNKTIPLSYEFVMWLNQVGLPSIIVINKIDRIKRRDLNQILKNVLLVLDDFGISIQNAESDEGLIQIIPVSAKKKKNMKNLETEIQHYFDLKFPNFE